MTDAIIIAFVKEVLLKDPEFLAKYGQKFAEMQSTNEDINDFSDALSPQSPPDTDKGLPLDRIILPPRPPSPVGNTDPSLLTEATLLDDVMDTSTPATDPASEESSADSSSSEDEFQLVTGGKRKKGKTPRSSQATKTKKVSVPSPTTTPTPSSSGQTIVAASASQISKRTPTPPAANLSRKQRIPPPLYIQDKGKWTEVSKMCVERRIAYTNARACANGIRVTVKSANDYRDLTRALKEWNVSFHTYTLPEDTPTRVVIRRVPREISTEEIKEDLLAQQVPVISVHRLHKARGGEVYDMILVVCEPVEGHHPIFKIKSVCSLSGISIEKPYKSTIVGQCHRCQLYGHAQSNCFATPRCVKCLGAHGTADCPRPRDHTQCTEPPSCVLCGQTGHPANYRGCPKAPKLAPKLAKRANARQQRESPSSRVPTSQIPERLAPQRPSPWNRLNHQKAFPALAAPPTPTQTPTPIPALMAKAIPAPVPMPAAPTASPKTAASAASIVTKAPAVGTTATTRKSVASIILKGYAIFLTPEAKALSVVLDAVTEAGQYDLDAAHKIWHQFESVAIALDNLNAAPNNA